MRQHGENPNGNTLSAGFPEAKVISAIAQSGYPLQGRIARKLQGEFAVTEEWAYFDKSTDTHRSLDLFAYRRHHSGSNTIHPSCALLIECKRSQYPYAFFQRIADHEIASFPHVLGINETINLRRRITSTQMSMRSFSAAKVLGLGESPFLAPGPPRSAAFSKIMRKGKELELSGAEPFHEIVLPLSRSLDHATELYKPPGNQSQIFPLLTLSICVLDAVMLLVEDPDRVTDPLLTPWVRVVRQETRLDQKRYRTPLKYYVVDVVHVDYFETFLHKHLMPFFDMFSSRVMQKSNILVSGEGDVQDLEKWDWQQVK
jgi:hypothetical protein